MFARRFARHMSQRAALPALIREPLPLPALSSGRLVIVEATLLEVSTPRFKHRVTVKNARASSSSYLTNVPSPPATPLEP